MRFANCNLKQPSLKINSRGNLKVRRGAVWEVHTEWFVFNDKKVTSRARQWNRKLDEKKGTCGDQYMIQECKENIHFKYR